MRRKVKFSRNWRKAKARVQYIHSHVANARRDSLHKTSTAISQNPALVCSGDWQVRNLSRSAADTTEQPGRNVSAKAGLNSFSLDQGWSEFHRQLDDKLARWGGWLVAVAPQNTSHTCPCCGHVSVDNRQIKPGLCVWPVAARPTPMGSAQAIAFLAGCKNCETKDGTDCTLAAGWQEPSARMACGSNWAGGWKQEPPFASAGRSS